MDDTDDIIVILPRPEDVLNTDDIDKSPAAGGSGSFGGDRLSFVDLLRGLVIILMVLDHTRDFFHKDAFLYQPTDLTKASPILFMTRWITHLCAPTFTFLAGVSIFLQTQKGKTGPRLSGFLFSRGLWLVALEVTLISFGFNFGWPFFFLQVIWAIGCSMMLMAGLVWLPRMAVFGIGVVIVAGAGLLGGVNADSMGQAGGLTWHLLMQPGGIAPLPGFIIYPVVPWLGIMCLGYGLGEIFMRDDEYRRRWLGVLAVGMIALFLVIRLPNMYGDPSPWSWQHNPLYTALSVMNVSKYPPSLDYTLVTIGVALLLGLTLENLPQAFKAPFLAFGRTPFMTYLIHLYIVHGLAVLVGLAMHVPPQDFFNFLGDPSRLIKAGWGLPLWGVYLIWLTIVVAMYPLSKLYADYRARRRFWWMSYL